MSDNPLQPLDDEQVEGTAGGYIYFAGSQDGFHTRWEAIDDKGNVIGRFGFVRDVIDFAESHGCNSFEITQEQLERLRKTGSIW